MWRAYIGENPIVTNIMTKFLTSRLQAWVRYPSGYDDTTKPTTTIHSHLL